MCLLGYADVNENLRRWPESNRQNDPPHHSYDPAANARKVRLEDGEAAKDDRAKAEDGQNEKL
jgi:hypothetical protein